MATEKQLGTDEEESGSSTPLSGSSTPLAESSGPAPAAAAPPASPSGRPNIKQYLNANQGAGQSLAEGIQHRYGEDAAKFNQGLDQTKSQFESSANPLEKKLGDEGSQMAKTSFKDPSAILADQQKMQDFGKLRDNGYNQDIQGLGQQFQQQKSGLQSQLGTLQNQAQMANTEQGRFQLLSNAFNQPNYTRGQQRLDQLFLQTQPNASRNLATNLNGMQSQAAQGLTGLDAQTQAKLSALQGLGSQRSQEIQGMLKGGLSSDLEGDINDRGLDDIASSSQTRFADAQRRAEAATGIQDRLSDPSLVSQNDLANTGLAGLMGQSNWGVNLNDYLKNINQNPTMAGAADAQEFARYRALQQLAGNPGEDVFGGAATGGGWNPYEYDSEGARQAIADQEKHWQTDEFNKVMQPYRDPSGGYSYFDSSDPRKAAWAPVYQSQSSNDLYNNLYNAVNWDQMNTEHGTGEYTVTPDIIKNEMYNNFGDISSYLKKMDQLNSVRIGQPKAGTPLPPGWTPPNSGKDGSDPGLTEDDKDMMGGKK